MLGLAWTRPGPNGVRCGRVQIQREVGHGRVQSFHRRLHCGRASSMALGVDGCSLTHALSNSAVHSESSHSPH